MRVLYLVCTLVFALTLMLRAQEPKGGGEGLLRRSNDAIPLDADPESMPGGPVGKAPLATGYYAVDNGDPLVGSPWRPTYVFLDTTGLDSRSWRRIRSGPNQLPMSTWSQPGSQGKEFFWNPSSPLDSTDNAFAGPIAIGFPFHYYGRAYDSFYVSTNGLIALSNRRYEYNLAGERIGYNPMRDDTLVRPRRGARAQDDPTPDDYGWRYVALGDTTSPIGGIRNPNNRALPDTSLRAVIAPLWNDQELSQYDHHTNMVDDFGRVYWRRDDSGDRLIIYFVNVSLKGDLFIPGFDVVATIPRREFRANFQVILNRADSSVQINYVRFLGAYFTTSNRFPWTGAGAIHGVTSTVGLQSNGDVPAPCTPGACPGTTGTEYTNYVARGRALVNGDASSLMHAGQALWFRQWANKARVLDARFDVPSRTRTGAFDTLAAGVRHANYELLLGHPLLGVIRPVGVVQNVSDSIGPVNRTPQPVSFDMRLCIRDLVNCTAPLVYETTKRTDSLHPIRVATASAPSIDTVHFDPFITNAQVAAQVGRFRVEVISTHRTAGGTVNEDRWPFDDTAGVRIFVISRQQIPYVTTFNDFNTSCDDGPIPHARQWVSIGAEVVDEQHTYDPPPPRGPSTGLNGTKAINSPVLRMDRSSIDGSVYQTTSGRSGDTLVSFPIDVSKASRPAIIVNYQRAGRNDYDRGWSDRIRVGPEHAVYNVEKTSFMQAPDRLVVEFAEPSPNGIDNIVNAQRWRDAGFGDTTRALTWRALESAVGAPRWAVFGGGGGLDTSGGIVVDELDAGKDFRFRRAVIPIPRRWTTDANANRSFRFRLRLDATDHGSPLGPLDDDDPIYVDNIYVTSLDRPEFEITAVGARWPYSIAPASQALAIPLYVTVANNGAAASTAFGVAMSIQNIGTPPPAGRFNYYRFRSIISLGAGQEYTESFPPWNAQECGTASADYNRYPMQTSHYRITAQLMPMGIDNYAANNTSHSDFRLTLGTVFAFDDTSRRSGLNSVAQLSREQGRGLDLVPPLEDAGWPNPLQPYGLAGGSGSGSFAARFTIVARDTVRGFQAYFGSANQQPDRILYALYRGTRPDRTPDTVIRATRVFAKRGEGIPEVTPWFPDSVAFDTYVTYLLPTPYVIEPGEYFVTVSQLGASGIALGGSARHQGQVTTIVDTVSTPRGLRNRSVPAHLEMNEQRFWFESGSETGAWHQMLQPTTNPGFPHLRYDGLVGDVPTYTRGSWIPMIRPYFGPRASQSCLVEPVELIAFDVSSLAAALQLDWSTASEVNNKGFHVERRTSDDDMWTSLSFVDGVGTSNRDQRYWFIDADVQREITYHYRLRQEDLDGSITYSPVREGRLAGATIGASVHRLEQSTPNPTVGIASIEYAIAGDAAATIDISDLHGSILRTYVVSGMGSISWDAADAGGAPVPNGVYVCRLTVGDETAVRKIVVMR